MSNRKHPSHEPFWWALFGAGGVFSAFFVPILVLLYGLAIPLGWIEQPAHADVLLLVQDPLVRLFLFVLISLSLFHWAHRFRFTLYDGLQIKHLNLMVALLCYGTAVVVTICAAALMISI